MALSLENIKMSSLLTNWKTSLTGAIILLIAALHTFLGINIPGAMDIGPAFTVALGLFLAKDSNVTGGTVSQ